MEDMSITFNHLNLTDIHGLLYPATAEYTFFSDADEMFNNFDHMIGHGTK